MSHETQFLTRMTAAPPTAQGNTLVGYAAVFDSPTEINSWEGHFREVIRPGAFKQTLDRNGDRVKILYDHGLDPSIGNKPLGKPSVIEEDDHGLRLEVPLDETSYNADLKASLRSGAIDGMSFRFSVPAGGDEWEDGEDGDIPTRYITNTILYEAGPVTFPAYEAASAGIRSAKDYEAWRRGNELTAWNITSGTLSTTVSASDWFPTVFTHEPGTLPAPGEWVPDGPTRSPVNPAQRAARWLETQRILKGIK